MANVKFFTSRTVQKGKNLSSMEEVKARLAQMVENKKSAYYKHMQEGRVQVHFVSGASMWNIVVITPHEPEGLSSCGECGAAYLNLENDYLCGECRAAA